MSYKNKTYVIFDGDNDMWAYAFMKGWKTNDKIDFNFYDAHDLKPLTDRANEETTKARLRERMADAKQVILIVGEKTKNLFRFVRWELDLVLEKNLPIIVVNLNDKRDQDVKLCPPIIRNAYAVHISFRMKIIKYALDNFPNQYANSHPSDTGPLHYPNTTYRELGL